MKIIVSIVLFLLMCPFFISGQEHEHSHARNELGMSPGVTYSPSHKEWGFGIHVHYFRTLGEHSPWSLGGSLEQISSHGSHWTVSAGGKYALFDRLNLAVMPGVTFFHHNDMSEEEHDHTKKAQFSIHFELGYDLIHLEHFHLGPAIDYSWTRHDNHFMLGIHCAYGF